MSIKVVAKQTLMKVGNVAGTYRFVLQAQLYNQLAQSKVIKEAAMRSGIAQGTINAAWAAIGEVIKAWATEGHSVAIPGLGTMRFGVKATSVADVAEVDTGLITTRKVIFTPNVDIKNELKATSINITCYDKDGNMIKTVTSEDDAEVEDGNDDSGSTDNGGSSSSDQGGSSTDDQNGEGGLG